MSNSPVSIAYNGKNFDVHTDTIGNKTIIPLVNIDISCEKDKNGQILNFTNNITLTSTILGKNPKALINAFDEVVGFFSDPDKQSKNFAISCDGQEIIKFSGTTFEGATAGTSENNWVITIPYTINLTSISAPSGEPPIESYEDSWTIEPLSEVSYYEIDESSAYYKYKNAGTPSNQAPSTRDLSVSTDPPFKANNYIQYRISHRLSATGKAATSPGNSNNPLPGGSINTNNQKIYAYQHAAQWVKERASCISGQGGSITGLVIAGGANSGVTLFNHMRTVETSIEDGTYSLTDTWLAINQGGLKYTEDFTWESSVDEKYMKTVTLNGTITGLEDVAAGGYTVFPDASLTGNIKGKLLPKFTNQSRSNSKFQNAVNVFQSAVKPSLYRRACTAVHMTQGGYSGVPNNGILNVAPVTYTETLNPVAGTVGYSVTYNNKPGLWMSGVLSTNMTIQDTLAADQIAESFVLGRPLGPIIQKVGTQKTERRVTLEVVYPIPTGYRESHPNSGACVVNKNRAQYKDLKELMDSFRPIAPDAYATLVPTSPYPIADAGVVFMTSDNQTWQPFEGRFNWERTWIYTTGNCSDL